MDDYNFDDLVTFPQENDGITKRAPTKKAAFKKKRKTSNLDVKNRKESSDERGSSSSDIRKRSNSEEPSIQTVNIHGTSVEICNFDGIPVLKEDWERLIVLKKKLEKQNIPKIEIKVQLKKVLNKASKSLGKLKKKFCLGCGLPGHVLRNCTSFRDESGVVVGSMRIENEYKFPRERERRLKPGSVCIVCGENTHLVEDCPVDSDEDPGKPKNKRQKYMIKKSLKLIMRQNSMHIE